MKLQMYKIIKIFKWKFIIRIPDFLNPWEYTEDNTIRFDKPPNKNDILEIRYLIRDEEAGTGKEGMYDSKN